MPSASIDSDLSPRRLKLEDRDDDIDFFECKKLRLDVNGIPIGSMVPMFVKDLHAFSKEMDPTATPGWL